MRLARWTGGFLAAALATWLFLTPGALPGGSRSDTPGWAAADEEPPARILLKDPTSIEDFLKAVKGGPLPRTPCGDRAESKDADRPSS